MEKTMTKEQALPMYKEENGLTYRLDEETQTYLPMVDLEVIPYEQTMWTRHRLEFLEQHKHATYQMLLVRGMEQHLTEINRQANEMEDRLMEQMSQAEGITAELKEKDPITWAQMRNNLKQRVREIIHNEIIYA
ncbi:MAG: TnpV protein [Firmicutes bacterium]|nr:TnpV protein [Bacillota bacterium]